MALNQQPENGSGNKKGAMMGGLGILGLGLLKAKGMWLVALKMLSGFKFLYVFKTFFSMFLMIGLYTAAYGWFYAVMVVGLILIHEMGHFIFMKAMNLDPGLPVFLPFMGAYVKMNKLPPDQTTHAWVAIAGPLVGGVIAVGFFVAGILLDNRALQAAGNTGVLLNLFQLVPCKPFDGGFVVNALSKWFLIPGTGLAFMFGVMFANPLVLIIACLSAFMTYRAFTRPPSPDGKIDGETPATMPEKIMIGTAYFALLSLLCYVYFISNNELISFMKPKF